MRSHRTLDPSHRGRGEREDDEDADEPCREAAPRLRERPAAFAVAPITIEAHGPHLHAAFGERAALAAYRARARRAGTDGEARAERALRPLVLDMLQAAAHPGTVARMKTRAAIAFAPKEPLRI